MFKVSVITTVYNGEQYIRQAIDSITSQSYVDFEMIVVNDGSTDSTADVLADIVDQKVKIFDVQHLGRTKALNYAISKSQGEYIAILDADDVALHNRLKKQVGYLDKNHDVSLISAGKRIGIDDKDNEIERSDIKIYNYQEIKDALHRRNPFFHSSVMFRRSAFIQVGGYDERLSCLEDWGLYVDLSKNHKIINLPDYFSKKRKHSYQFFDGFNGYFQSPNKLKARAYLFIKCFINIKPSPYFLYQALKLYTQYAFLIQKNKQ
jgi:glycosyltransferase involved in cell wall biosynthesis